MYALGGFSKDLNSAEIKLGGSGSIIIFAIGSSINGLKLVPRAAGVGTVIIIGDLSGSAVEHWSITNCFIGNPVNSTSYYFANAILFQNAWYGTISGNELMNVPAYVGQYGTGINGLSSENISVTLNTIMSFSRGMNWSTDTTVGHRCKGWMINNNTIIDCTQAAFF